MPKDEPDLPSTLERSPEKVQRSYQKTLDSAEDTYDGDEARAHRTAWSAVKHVAEKAGDHWELKDEKGPSDAQAAKSGAAARRGGETKGGVNAAKPKAELYEDAKRADIEGRSDMTKDELADALKKHADRETRKAREGMSPGGARQVSRRSLLREQDAGGSRTTILIALAANVLVAVVKLAGGLLSGSTALLAEAAHSVADTFNQVFLLASVALSAREPTEDQPFGHGHQRFLWTFVAAIGMFLAGAVFAIGYGIVELLAQTEGDGGFAIAWATLVIAFLAEGTSLVRAVRQTRGAARAAGKGLWRYSRESREPSVKMVLFEDSAALVGIAIAAIGIGLHQLTGDAAFDAASSVVIGVGLIGVATFMARDTGRLLVGAAALPEERAEMERIIEGHGAVAEVVELLTMALGPRALLVAARIDLDDGADARQVERAATEIDAALREAIPDVTEVFLDATPGRDADRDARAQEAAAPVPE